MINIRAIQETFKGLESGEVTVNPADAGWDGPLKNVPHDKPPKSMARLRNNPAQDLARRQVSDAWFV